MDAKHYDAKRSVELQKLDAEVDKRLAASDGQFAANLRDWQASEHVEPNGGKSHRIPLAEQQYMEQKRAAFWAAEKAKLDVQLSDPSLKTKCGL